MKTWRPYLYALFLVFTFSACSDDEPTPDLSTEGLLKGNWTQRSMIYVPFVDGVEMKYSSAKADLRAAFDGSKFQVNNIERNYSISIKDGKNYITIKDWKGKDATFEITAITQYNMSWHRDDTYTEDGVIYREVETGEFKKVF